MMWQRAAIGMVWLAAISSVAWTARTMVRFDREVDTEAALARDRARYIWQSYVAVGQNTDSASADVLALTTRELTDGHRDTTRRLTFMESFDAEAFWASHSLNPVVDPVYTLPRTAAESLSLRVAQSKFNRLFRVSRPFFEQRVQRRVRRDAALAAGLLALGVLSTASYVRPRRRLPLIDTL